jgi:hypothetical protein
MKAQKIMTFFLLFALFFGSAMLLYFTGLSTQANFMVSLTGIFALDFAIFVAAMILLSALFFGYLPFLPAVFAGVYFSGYAGSNLAFLIIAGIICAAACMIGSMIGKSGAAELFSGDAMNSRKILMYAAAIIVIAVIAGFAIAYIPGNEIISQAGAWKLTIRIPA